MKGVDFIIRSLRFQRLYLSLRCDNFIYITAMWIFYIHTDIFFNNIMEKLHSCLYLPHSSKEVVADLGCTSPFL